MFIGSTTGTTATVVLPDDGVYVVRVYLMRNASRRNETSNYTLTFRRHRQAAGPAVRGEGCADPRHEIPCVGPDAVHAAVRKQAPALRGIRHPARLRRHRHRRDPWAEFDAAPYPVRRWRAGCVGLARGHDAFARWRSNGGQIWRRRALRPARCPHPGWLGFAWSIGRPLYWVVYGDWRPRHKPSVLPRRQHRVASAPSEEAADRGCAQDRPRVPQGIATTRCRHSRSDLSRSRAMRAPPTEPDSFCDGATVAETTLTTMPDSAAMHEG